MLCMDLLGIIRQRRSVRKFKKGTPPGAVLKQLLEAGRWAPSGMNNQPWRFLLISGKKKKDSLSLFTKYAGIIKAAPALIAVFMDIADSYNRDKDLMAIGACIENMLLEGQSLGLGMCWLGEILNKKDEVVRYLRVDPDLELMAVIAVGYPDKKIALRSRKPLKSLLVK